MPEWHVTDIISQSDVLRLLAAHNERLDAAFGASLASLDLVQHSVHTVTADTPALAGALPRCRGRCFWCLCSKPLTDSVLRPDCSVCHDA